MLYRVFYLAILQAPLKAVQQLEKYYASLYDGLQN
jgi:hypothetical protein